MTDRAAPSEAEALVERLGGIATQIAVARQVGEDGYWTMKVSDGAYLLDLIASLRTEVERLQEQVREARGEKPTSKHICGGSSVCALCADRGNL